jgi:hypothetical protein
MGRQPEKKEEEKKKKPPGRSLGAFATLVRYKPCDDEKKIIGSFHLNISQLHRLSHANRELNKAKFHSPNRVL